MIITQQDRCEQLNDVGGCMVQQDCNQKTKEERENVLCYVEVVTKKRRVSR
jgi:hypothetical protein